MHNAGHFVVATVLVVRAIPIHRAADGHCIASGTVTTYADGVQRILSFVSSKHGYTVGNGNLAASRRSPISGANGGGVFTPGGYDGAPRDGDVAAGRVTFSKSDASGIYRSGGCDGAPRDGDIAARRVLVSSADTCPMAVTMPPEMEMFPQEVW